MPRKTRNIKDLGELTGDVLIFGGPYSNLQATEALFQIAKTKNIPPSHRICTGDVVAYCGNPKETLDLISRDCEWLAGNCEKQLAVNSDNCGCGFDEGSACDVLSRGWYGFANAEITTNQRYEMENCPDLIAFHHSGKHYAVVHGGGSDISKFIWSVSDDIDFIQEIETIEAEIGKVDFVLAGHSGIAFQRQVGAVTWLNAGVIGMPQHDGNQTTKYAVITNQGPKIETLIYDVESAVAAMLNAGLTQGYEITLASGIWPSQDILPQKMRY